MSVLSSKWLAKQTIDLKMAACLREIGEHKGRAEMFGTHVLAAMELLRQVTAEHSAAAACRLERTETSVEQANYQRLVGELQDSAVSLPVAACSIERIHAELFSGASMDSAGILSAETSERIAKLCRDYLKLETSTESLLLIGTFVSELLQMQPFSAGNLRTALLVAVWLLNRQGYSAVRYVSMERLLERQACMPDASIDLWWNCWLETLLGVYREMTSRSRALSGRRGMKTDMVLARIGSLPGEFSIRQIQQLVPECGIELIRKIFKEQKAAGNIKCLGRGPNALWRKKRSYNGGII